MRTSSRLLLAAALCASLFAAASAAAEPLSPRGVLIDFTATWCGPCQEMSPIVKRLWREGYPVRKVDIDSRPELARKFGISGIPAFVLLVDGEEVARVVGRTSETKLRQMLAMIPAATAGGTNPAHIAAAEQPSRPAASLPVSSPAPSSPRTVPVSTPARSVPATFASADFEEPVIRANLDRGDGVDRVDAAARVIGDPLAASVRLRVKDKKGVNFGSGTIVDSRPGRTVILSCGHIFRDIDQDATIEVDVFENGRVETYLGQVLRYDLEGDVGLLTVPTDGWLPVCAIADPAHKIAMSEQATSIGCGKGDPPSESRVRVTRINRYVGPENVECTGVPIQGRSGGGLFDSAGRVVGVCIAADNRDQRGLYAGLAPVHDLLDRCELTYLYRPVDDADARIAVAASAERDEFVAPAAVDSPSSIAAAATPARNVAAVESREAVAAVARDPYRSASLSDPERSPVASREPSPSPANDHEAALAEALRTAGDAEVICIIRSHDDPQSNSRVVIINRASPKFVSYLTGEIAEQPRAVSHRAPADATAAEDATADEGIADEFADEIADELEGAAADDPQPYRRSRSR
ncbi:MAG: thioredoxin domain-containing protein [Planctomycetaceae bacterium]